MPYSKLSKRILAGSVNYLPPGDLIPAEDARQMQNFRVDQAGNLRSRHGSRSLVPVPLAGNDVHTLSYRAGASPAFYVGVGANLFRDYSQIASGFDGQPLGIAASQKFAWIMNRTKRGKDNGATFMNWLPDPPASAPTLTVGAEERKTIANFENGEAWVTANELASPTPYFDVDDKVQGSTSLRFVTDAAGNPRAELPFTLDLGIDGKQRDEDLSKIWIWLLDPTSVDAVTLMVDVNDGTFTQDYYVATIPREKFNEAGQTWNEIEILRALAQDDVSGRLAFTRFGATPGKDWSTTVKVRVQADLNSSGQVKFDEWTFSGGFSFLKGQARYYITFDTAEGHESNPSPPTEFKNFDNQPATLNSIPTSPDPQVTMRHIYSERDSLGGAFRVATINDNTSVGPWRDVYPDDLVTDLNVPLEKDHDPPPPARGVAGEYFNRLLAYSSAEFPARMWWTKPNRPWYFPGSDEKDADNFTDVGDHGEELYATSPHKRWAALYKQFSIWRLTGDPDDGELEQTNATMGILGPTAWCAAGAVDYFASESGIYRFNGDHEEKVSLRIESIFKGETAEISPGILVLPMERQYAMNSVLAYKHGRLYFSYPELGNQFPSQTLVLDIDSGRWSTYLLPSGLQQRGFRSLLHQGQAPDLIAGDTSGVVFSFESSSSQADTNRDRGLPIPLAYHSGYQDVGLADNEKLFADLEIEYNTGVGASAGSALTVKLFYNNGASEEAIGTIRSNTRSKEVFPVNAGEGKEAYNAAVRIEGDATTVVEVYAIYLHYYPLPRKAKNYDSDVQDGGTFLVKQFDQMEIEIDSSATVTWKFLTDVPGGLMSQRSTGSFVATNGRKTVNLRAPDFPLVEGKRYRVTLSCPGGLFRLFDLKVRIKPIGEYVDGAAGEFWESSEVGYA